MKIVVGGLFVVLAAILGSTSGHTYHTGSCPSVSPVNDFQMNNVSDLVC